MAGGALEAVERARPFLAAMGKRIVACGGPGAGQAAKMCNNMILGISMIGIAEAFVLAEKLGLDHQALFDVASTSSGQCWALTNHCPVPGPVPASAANRGYKPGFATALMLKDLTLARDAADSVGAGTALGRHAAGHLRGFRRGRECGARLFRRDRGHPAGLSPAQSGAVAGFSGSGRVARAERPDPMPTPDAEPPSARRALLIVNEHSRSGRERGDEAEAALEAAGLTVTRGHNRLPRGRVPPHPRDARRRRPRRGGGRRRHDQRRGARDPRHGPAARRPAARHRQRPRPHARACRWTSRAPWRLSPAGRTRRIDLGEVNGHPYFNVASLGFGVDLTHALTSDAKKRWGPLGYAVAGLRVLRRLRPFHVDIEIGDVRQASRTVHLAVGNGRHYGGGMTVSHDAEIDDGRLDVYSLEIGSVWKLLLLLPALRSGRTRDWTEIRTLDGAEIRVTAHRERSVNADGEIVTRTPAVFRVLHGAVAVYVPD